MEHYDLVIIGAGISGLSAAYHAAKCTDKSILVLEQRDTIGGLCSSFTVPCAEELQIAGLDEVDFGIHTLFTNSTYVKQLYDKLVPSTQEREAKILLDSTQQISVDYPFQTNLHQLPPVLRTEFVDAWKTACINKSVSQSFMLDFETTYGKRMSDEFFVPYNSKKFGNQAHMLPSGYGGRKHVKATINQIDDIVVGRGNGGGHCPEVVYPTTGAFHVLPQYLWAQAVQSRSGRSIPIHLWCNSCVQHVAVDAKTLWVHHGTGGVCTVTYDKLISTSPNNFYAKSKDEVLFGDVLVPTDFDTMFTELYCEPVSVYAVVIPNELLAYQDHWLITPSKNTGILRVTNFNRLRQVDKYTCAYTMLLVEVEGSPVNRGTNIIEELYFCGVTTKLTGWYYHLPYGSYGYPLYTRYAREFIDQEIIKLKRRGVWCIGRFGRWEYLDADECILEGARVIVEIGK